MGSVSLTRVEALQAAIRRLPRNYERFADLEKELRNAEAGVRGEYRLKRKFIEFYTERKFEIMWNVSLSLGDWPVQIDGLLLTGTAAMVIESKNISGDLYFNNETGEFYRINAQGEKTVMDNPAIQVEKHIRFIKAWFSKQSIHLRVDGLLVFTAIQSELKTLPQNIHTCRVHQMIEKLFRVLNNHPNPLYTDSSLKDLRVLIESRQTPYVQKPVSLYYSIDQRNFATGIYCVNCKTHTIKRHHGKWFCSQCGATNNEAAFQAVREYFAIMGGPVSNKTIREFTGISDRHQVKRLLAGNKLMIKGNKRYCTYLID